MTKYIYAGERLGTKNKLFSALLPIPFILTSDETIEDKLIFFDRFKKGRFGIGQIVEGITKDDKSFYFSPTEEYTDKSISDKLRTQSFLNLQTYTHELERKKIISNSRSIGDLTIDEIIKTSNYSHRRAIIAYLLEKMGW